MLANRVEETTTTTGTGNLTLAGAVANSQTFNNALGTDVRFTYFIVDDTNTVWETGIGYLSAATTLVRETVLDNSSGTTSALNLSAGTKNVFIGDNYKSCFSPVLKYANRFISESIVRLGTFTFGNLNTYYVPVLIRAAQSISAMGLDFTSASGTNFRLGLYDVGTDGYPGKLITETAELVSASGYVSGSCTADITPGWYYVAIKMNAGDTIRSGFGGSLYYFPSPLGAQGSSVYSCCRKTIAYTSGSFST
jgi:hypothetical protein